MSDTRDAFEIWFTTSRGAGMLDRFETGGYLWVAASEAWDVWQAATLAAKRQPLTDQQIVEKWRSAYLSSKAFTTVETYTYFAREIEAAHGIKA